jgi:hypothetical protein
MPRLPNFLVRLARVLGRAPAGGVIGGVVAAIVLAQGYLRRGGDELAEARPAVLVIGLLVGTAVGLLWGLGANAVSAETPPPDPRNLP